MFSKKLSDHKPNNLELSVDTIRLKFRYDLPNTTFFEEKITDKELNFEFPDKNKRYIYTNNKWRKSRQEKGLYTPKYGIGQDFCNPDITYLVIEFSAPKLIHGENISGLSEQDLPAITETLLKFLKEIGVLLSTHDIQNAIPTLIAFGRNINLTRICTSDLAIQALSPFDYKPNARFRVTEFLDLNARGKEIIFSIPKTETFKLYDKVQEIINNADTYTERKIANAIQTQRYKSNQVWFIEILRAELTLKTPRKIRQRLTQYLSTGQRPTLKNIFKQNIWDAILKEEMSKIYDQPLRPFIYLAQQDKPLIDAFLDKGLKHSETKDTARGIISSLQEFGLTKTRRNYLQKYNSRQSWYNYVKRLEDLTKYCDFSSLAKTNNYQLHQYILKQFGIEIERQGQFDFKGLSKKLDTKPRNTSGENFDYGNFKNHANINSDQDGSAVSLGCSFTI